MGVSTARQGNRLASFFAPLRDDSINRALQDLAPRIETPVRKSVALSGAKCSISTRLPVCRPRRAGGVAISLITVPVDAFSFETGCFGRAV